MLLLASTLDVGRYLLSRIIYRRIALRRANILSLDPDLLPWCFSAICVRSHMSLSANGFGWRVFQHCGKRANHRNGSIPEGRESDG